MAPLFAQFALETPTSTATETTSAIASPTATGVATPSGFMNSTSATPTAAAEGMWDGVKTTDWQTVVAVVLAILIVVVILTGVMYCKINRVSRSEAEALRLEEDRDSLAANEMELPPYNVQHVEAAAPESPPTSVTSVTKETTLDYPAFDVEQDHHRVRRASILRRLRGMRKPEAPPPPPPSPTGGAPIDHEVPLPTGMDFGPLHAMQTIFSHH